MAQIKVSTDIDKNFNKIIKILKEIDSDIYIFPEMALTGYDIQNIPSIDEIRKKIILLQQSLTDNKMVIIGSAYYEDNAIFNSALVITNNEIKIYYKNTLTEYDKKIFSSKENILIINYDNLKLGVIICRDQSNLKLIQKYENKIDLLIQLSAHYYKNEEAIKKLDKNIAYPIIRAIDTKAFVCKVNCVGYLNNLISLGSSMIVDNRGVVLKMANRFEEEIIKIKLRRKDDYWIYDGSI
jgi:predicted amidohydrolase